MEILLIEDNPYDAELTIISFKKNHLLDKLKVITDGAVAFNFIFGNGKSIDEKNFNPQTCIWSKITTGRWPANIAMSESDTRTQKIPVVVLTSFKEEKDII